MSRYFQGILIVATLVGLIARSATQVNALRHGEREPAIDPRYAELRTYLAANVDARELQFVTDVDWYKLRLCPAEFALAPRVLTIEPGPQWIIVDVEEPTNRDWVCENTHATMVKKFGDSIALMRAERR